MITPSLNFVSTDLARLHVRRTGTGPPVVLWHRLFVHSRSWGPLVEVLARDRTVCTIDAPSHGKSGVAHRDFTFEELVAAAEQALDRLGLAEPVDWVGNLGWPYRHSPSGGRAPATADVDNHRHAGPGLHAGGEAHQGLATGPDVSVHRAKRLSS